MKKLLTFLDRFFNRTYVRNIGEEEIPRCVEMAVQSLNESGIHISPDAPKRLREHFSQISVTEYSTALVAYSGKKITGMVCCGMVEPDLWDGRRTAMVWFLYVEPGSRHHPGVALALLRGCFARICAWGAERVRIAVNEEHARLMDKYERRMEFRREASYRAYSLDIQE